MSDTLIEQLSVTLKDFIPAGRQYTIHIKGGQLTVSERLHAQIQDFAARNTMTPSAVVMQLCDEIKDL
jgi:hypothetical protein